MFPVKDLTKMLSIVSFVKIGLGKNILLFTALLKLRLRIHRKASVI
jgi:hypothetical protein